MHLDVIMCLNKCKQCAESKKTDYGNTKLKPTISNFPFQKIAIDIAGPLPTSNEGFRFILCVVDYFSKFPALIPLKEISSEIILEALYKRWFSILGYPYQIHSDNATYFNSELIQQVCQKLNILQTYSSPYHPKGNGLVERTIQTSKTMLRTLLFNHKKMNGQNI